jgi:two-component system sensor histidine kinase HydH
MSMVTPVKTQPPVEVPTLGLDDLRQLMRSVNETTQRLQHTHESLQLEVSRLQGELVEANAQLRRSRSLAALGEMAAGIAHEVRNPLASIGLYAQMLGEDLADRPETAQLAGKIGGAVNRIDTIVRDVLRFARDTSVQPRRVSVVELVEEALESCRATLAETDVSVVIKEAVGSPLQVEVDPTLMVQAIANVIRNAAEAMGETTGGTRTVHVRGERSVRRLPSGERCDRIVIGVEDSGPGIAPEVLERMFNPFFTTRPTGTGLGLAIVHRIVEAHDGHVVVLNRDEGGATVELCVPPISTRSTQ